MVQLSNTSNRVAYQTWIKVGGISLLVPLSVSKLIPNKGEAVFVYFPNSHYLWTVNGEMVWSRGQYPFW